MGSLDLPTTHQNEWRMGSDIEIYEGALNESSIDPNYAMLDRAARVNREVGQAKTVIGG